MPQDRRLASIVNAVNPGVPPLVEPFPETPTAWAQAYALSWPEYPERYVVRLIDAGASEREAVRIEFRAARLLGEKGIGPAVRSADAEEGVLVMDRVDGHPVRPAARWQALSVADLLAQLHSLAWDNPARLYAEKRRVAGDSVLRLTERIPALALFGEALREFDALRAGLRELAVPQTLCHNDLNPGNMLFDGRRAWLIDFDHVGPGDPLFDVATAIDSLGLLPKDADAFLARYFGRPPTEGEAARLELLGCLVLLRYGLSGLSLVPEELQPGLASWTPDDIGEAWVFERAAHEALGRSVFRLSLGFATAGLARLRGEPAARALRTLGIGTAVTARREAALVGTGHAEW
ncbi:phosphotransferase [Streptomyces sp. NBC_01136]|uniref:phosphotransferase n=1 Tax=unclassified Streptomyces TaxID=2593676 RepID=UPI003249F156|nr:phosphotransferase [Streptomyces sp. NBC_01136]